MKTTILILAGLLFQVSFVFSQSDNPAVPVLKGPYLGQVPPGEVCKVFAPGFISTDDGELNSVFTKDGTEFYFSRRGIPGKPSMIMFSKMVNGVWTKPGPVEFTGTYSDIDLFIPLNGEYMVFCSTRSFVKGMIEKPDHDFWVSGRKGDTWTEPLSFAENVTSDYEDFYPVVTASFNLYFNSQRGGPGTNDIYWSDFSHGTYLPPVKLPSPINTEYREFDAYVSPDDKMIVFSSDMPGGSGRADIYVSFKKADNSWTKPRNLGQGVNSSASEYGSMLSPDGKYLFFTSNRSGSEDIYWVSASVIEKLKP